MPNLELNALVLQGGGALGAYQAGAFEKLQRKGISVDWVAGISIGAINAAIICGNPKNDRVPALRAFWEKITSGVNLPSFAWNDASRKSYSELAAAEVAMMGAPGFFKPRLPMAFWPFGQHPVLSYYDTEPLAETLRGVVDFDYLNDRGPRLSVGATDIETGNFVYFDNRSTRIDERHIMASGALPPGFAPVEIDGRSYWDGGLVSNTPLQYVMENAGSDPLCVFQIDLFNARGEMPGDIMDVEQREKDIRYSSRTRLTTDRYQQLHEIRSAADRLAEKLPKDMQSDPDLARLRAVGPACPVCLMHLIHRKEGFEGSSKDYEFSRLTMMEHWAAGQKDVDRSFAHKTWKSRQVGKDGLQIFDLASKS